MRAEGAPDVGGDGRRALAVTHDSPDVGPGVVAAGGDGRGMRDPGR